MHKHSSGCARGWTAVLQAAVQGPSFPVLDFILLRPCSHLSQPGRITKTVPPPKALACITLLASGGKISVTWPHFTARRMGNEAWLCARVKETLDLVRRSAVPTRVGVVSPPGICWSPTHQVLCAHSGSSPVLSAGHPERSKMYFSSYQA